MSGNVGTEEAQGPLAALPRKGRPHGLREPVTRPAGGWETGSVGMSCLRRLPCGSVMPRGTTDQVTRQISYRT